MQYKQRLTARRVEKLLEALGTVVARGRTGEEVPAFTLTLHLTHGHQLSGEFVDYVPREAVLLDTGREGLVRGVDTVAYVDLASVVAVTVNGADKLLLVPGLARAVPSREELARQAERLARGITEQFWPAEEQLGGTPLRFELEWKGLDDEPGRLALEGAMNAVAHALRAIGKEEGGRNALHRYVKLQFIHGEQTAAKREGDVGKVTVAPGAPTPSVQVLRKSLAAGL